jgi:hypothetical protein
MIELIEEAVAARFTRGSACEALELGDGGNQADGRKASRRVAPANSLAKMNAALKITPISQSGVRPQLARSRPVLALDVLDDDVDRLSAAGKRRHRRFGHGFNESTLLFDRAAFE